LPAFVAVVTHLVGCLLHRCYALFYCCTVVADVVTTFTTFDPVTRCLLRLVITYTLPRLRLFCPVYTFVDFILPVPVDVTGCWLRCVVTHALRSHYRLFPVCCYVLHLLYVDLIVGCSLFCLLLVIRFVTTILRLCRTLRTLPRCYVTPFIDVCCYTRCYTVYRLFTFTFVTFGVTVWLLRRLFTRCVYVGTFTFPLPYRLVR